MRIEKDYQTMFHPLKNLVEGQGKKKPIGKAAALWICTLGVYPLVAGLTHLIKKGIDQHRAKKLEKDDLNPGVRKADTLAKSHLANTDPESSNRLRASSMASNSAGPSASYFEQAEKPTTPPGDAQSTASRRPQDEEGLRLSKRLSQTLSASSPTQSPEVSSLSASPSAIPSHSIAEEDEPQATPPVDAQSTAPREPEGVTPQITQDEMAKAWKDEMIRVRDKAAAGDVNAEFQMLVWQIEGRNIGDVNLMPFYDKIVLEACKADNPEALLLSIKDLYTKREEPGARTKKIDGEIAFLRRWLEKLKGPEAEAAQAKLWALGKDE